MKTRQVLDVGFIGFSASRQRAMGGDPVMVLQAGIRWIEICLQIINLCHMSDSGE